MLLDTLSLNAYNVKTRASKGHTSTCKSEPEKGSVMRRFCAVAFAAILVFGCASQPSIEQYQSPRIAAVLPDSLPADPVAAESMDVIEMLPDQYGVPNDTLIAAMLESARQHYVSAAAAAESGDSTRSVIQFEEAISILDELSYIPDIESNRDFNDLSRAVVEDYEHYIVSIDSLSTESSIFALREKLNQIVEVPDTIAPGPVRPIIQGTTIPLVMNDLVERHLQFFQGRGRVHMERWLKNASKYFPVVKPILIEEGVPEEIAFLSMVESGANPLARSWARAVGMWQFMKGTGHLYGLRSTYWYDERRDFEKATRAAARHMKDLYEEFGDWYLAMAAYNSGAGRVYSGIRRTGTTDFWEMRRRLPRETRNYVPTYIATALIAMNPEAYGFGDVEHQTPVSFDVVKVNDCVDLKVLADCAATETETLRELNPELLHWCTPPGVKDYRLRIPDGRSSLFNEKYARLSNSMKRDWIVHTVRRGETLGGIAARYGISSGIVAETNRLKSTKRLSVGSTLAIPVPKGSTRHASLVAASSASDRSEGTRRNSRVTVRNKTRLEKALAQASRRSDDTHKGKSRVSYSVKRGDTIGHLAEWFACRAADIRNWNDIPYGRPIRAGQELEIFVPDHLVSRYKSVNEMSFAEKEKRFRPQASVKEEQGNEETGNYVVREGDTLEDISKERGVTIEQVKRWNNLNTSTIRVGQRLLIHASAENVKIVDKAPANQNAERKDGKVVVYVVKRGDTLWDIARAHEVSPDEIRDWNDLKKNGIRAGQELRIHTNGSGGAGN